MGGRLAAVVVAGLGGALVRTGGRMAGNVRRAAGLVVIVIAAVCIVGGPAAPAFVPGR